MSVCLPCDTEMPGRSPTCERMLTVALRRRASDGRALTGRSRGRVICDGRRSANGDHAQQADAARSGTTGAVDRLRRPFVRGARLSPHVGRRHRRRARCRQGRLLLVLRVEGGAAHRAAQVFEPRPAQAPATGDRHRGRPGPPDRARDPGDAGVVPPAPRVLRDHPVRRDRRDVRPGAGPQPRDLDRRHDPPPQGRHRGGHDPRRRSRDARAGDSRRGRRAHPRPPPRTGRTRRPRRRPRRLLLPRRPPRRNSQIRFGGSSAMARKPTIRLSAGAPMARANRLSDCRVERVSRVW